MKDLVFLSKLVPSRGKKIYIVLHFCEVFPHGEIFDFKGLELELILHGFFLRLRGKVSLKGVPNLVRRTQANHVNKDLLTDEGKQLCCKQLLLALLSDKLLVEDTRLALITSQCLNRTWNGTMEKAIDTIATSTD